MLMDEGASAAAAGGGGPTFLPSASGAAPSVAFMAGLAWRRRIPILLTALAFGAAAFAYGKLAEPRFVATAQLYIDPRDIQIVDRALTTNGQDGSNNIAVVESQARVVTSTAVLRRVVAAENLMEDPEFTGGQGWAGWLERLGLARPKPADEAGIARALEERIGVHRAERTFVVDVRLRSSDPEKAARLANAVAEGYLAEESNARAAAARRASTALSGRLAELREAVRLAEDRVEQYRARHNLLGARGQLVDEQQLADVNAQLATARARVADAQARFDQIEAARRALRDNGAITEAVNSQTIGALRTQYAELRRRQAELANELGSRHPQFRSVETQVRDVQRSIGEEVARITQAARADLDRARSLEAATARSLEALKQRSAETGQAQVQLRELEREAEASRGVYQAFLTRARETGEQESLNTANARIITVATPPKARSYPPRVVVLVALGLALGAACGTALALWPALARTGRPNPDAPRPRTRRERAEAALAPAPPAPRLPVLARLTTADLVRHPPRMREPGETVDLALVGLPVLRATRSPSDFALALRRVREVLVAEQPPGAPRRIAVAGPDAAARRIAALNLALASARDGETVLLVDAEGGLTRAVLGREEARRAARGPVSGLNRLVRHTANHVTLVLAPLPGLEASAQAGALRALLRPGTPFDLVVIDAPMPDFGALPAEADDLLLVLPPDGAFDEGALSEAARARLRGTIEAAFEATAPAPAAIPVLSLVR